MPSGALEDSQRLDITTFCCFTGFCALSFLEKVLQHLKLYKTVYIYTRFGMHTAGLKRLDHVSGGILSVCLLLPICTKSGCSSSLFSKHCLSTAF